MKNLLLPFLVFTFVGCFPELENLNQQEIDDSISIDIPDGFFYETYRKVNIKIVDSQPDVKYELFYYSDIPKSRGNETYENEAGDIITEEVFTTQILDNQLSSNIPFNGVLEFSQNVPNYVDRLYLRRKDAYLFSSHVVEIINNTIEYNHISERSTKNSNYQDMLYCVNSDGELFTVNPINGRKTFLSLMPMGSLTCAIDQTNKKLYSVGKSSPHPLMEYSIIDNSWTTVADLNITGNRLEFNQNDHLLYLSKDDEIHTINTSDGSRVNSWGITDIVDIRGGDLSFSDDGTLYISTFSGIYKLVLDIDNNRYKGQRISSENLPFIPTSMTFDSNQELWIATDGNRSDLIIMDIETGVWQYKYGPNSANNQNFNGKVHDLTSLKIIDNSYNANDSDGDGISDIEDSAPNNSEIAFELYSPSKYGLGTIAFEDLWPASGDYDFNDVAFNYQFIIYTNSQNLALQIDLNITPKSYRSGSINAIGFVINGVHPSKVESVNNNQIFENYLNFNENGTEMYQDDTVVIITDNAHKMSDYVSVRLKFNTPIDINSINAPPFNPFIISNKTRDREIHLPNMMNTNLGAHAINNYIGENGFPWGISIVDDFKVSKESIPINLGYTHFNSWASSGGTQHTDWYKDNTGYRNNEYLED